MDCRSVSLKMNDSSSTGRFSLLEEVPRFGLVTRPVTGTMAVLGRSLGLVASPSSEVHKIWTEGRLAAL